MDYKRLNTVTGWLVFIVAGIVYLSTIEPTTSFWDCGEFIAAAYKLQVGHPPGAPFFLILARIFTLFASDPSNVAKMVNIMSALASAFTIMFLFWTITHLAKKSISNNNVNTAAKYILITGSGLVGALAYTFTDTFWFSAVEAEVYSTSSLFTAVVFWSILKWENDFDKKYANRWLILIAFLMGLSVGVHLLNLLALPAIVLIFYFKKYPVTTKGIIISMIISITILGSIMYILIPGIVKLGCLFELFVINKTGFKYNSGAQIYILFLIGVLIVLLYYTFKKKHVIMNTIILCVTVFMIGYSSYAQIIIRSSADPPMDQNDPETMFNLLSYLNREQYGKNPFFYGEYFNAPGTRMTGKAIYYKVKDDKGRNKYEAKYFRPEIKYDKNYKGLLPRMYSTDERHIQAYLVWAKMNEKDLYNPVYDENTGGPARGKNGNIIYDRENPKKKPSFVANIRFLMRYQLGHMYFRYFMWNFSGRQNDYQSYYKQDITKGNWITGIKILDSTRLGNQDKIPPRLANNKAKNTYYMLPLLLGLFGFFYQYKRNKKDFWVVATLFFFTGIAIVLYLNQPPFQPRERDYAYAGSFYAFAIWIGLGVMALIDIALNLKWENIKKPFTYIVTGLLVLLLMEYLINNKIVLTGHLAILFICGTAMIAFMMLFGKTIRNEKLITSLVLILTMGVPVLLAYENRDDHNRSGRYFARDIAYNYLNSCEKNAIIYTNGDNDTFPLWYAQEVEGIRTDVRVVNLSYLSADWYIEQMERKAYESDVIPLTLDENTYRQGTRDIVYLIRDDRVKGYIDLKEAIEFVASEEKWTKTHPLVKSRIEYIPGNKFKMKIDTSVIHDERVNKNDPYIRFEMDSNSMYVLKNHLIVLDMLSSINWRRPVYFAITVSSENYLNLMDYFELHGMAYKVVPYKTERTRTQMTSIDVDIAYENFMNVFKYEGYNNPELYMNEDITGIAFNLRNNFISLAVELIQNNKPDSAKKVLDKCIEVIPNEAFHFNYYALSVINAYYALGEYEKGNEIAFQLRQNMSDELEFINSQDEQYSAFLEYEKSMAVQTYRDLYNLAMTYKQDKVITLLQEDSRP